MILYFHNISHSLRLYFTLFTLVFFSSVFLSSPMDLQQSVQPSSTTKKMLNDLVAINVLVAGSCFVALVAAVIDQGSLKKTLKCNPTQDAMVKLVMYEIFSYIFLLLSSLVAHSLKTWSLNTPLKERLYRITAMPSLSTFFLALIFMILTLIFFISFFFSTYNPFAYMYL